MFLDNDEHILLLQQRPNPLTLASLREFKSLGIKTIMHIPWLSWHEMEPTPGNYLWATGDAVIDLARQAGLKSILGLYVRSPDWAWPYPIIAPDYNGGIDTLFNLPVQSIDCFNPIALDAELNFLTRACAHYTSSDVQCCYAMPYGAERIIPPNMPHTEQQVIDLVLARQSVFARYSDNLWTAFHPSPAQNHEGTANECLWTCHNAMLNTFPRHAHNRIIYTFFTLSSFKNDIPGTKLWVGAEYCANVLTHAKVLFQYNAWGMVMCHTHSFYDIRQPNAQEFANTALAVDYLKSYVPYG